MITGDRKSRCDHLGKLHLHRHTPKIYPPEGSRPKTGLSVQSNKRGQAGTPAVSISLKTRWGGVTNPGPCTGEAAFGKEAKSDTPTPGSESSKGKATEPETHGPPWVGC